MDIFRKSDLYSEIVKVCTPSLHWTGIRIKSAFLQIGLRLSVIIRQVHGYD